MKRAAIYARFSSDNQKETSIDDQVRECRAFAKRSGLKIVGVYDDHAMTGRNDNRPGLQRLIQDSAGKLFDIVLVWKLDRIGRNRTEMAMNRYRLKKNGVKITSITENIPETPEGIILESVLEGMAEYYSENLSVNVSRGLRGVALQCHHTGGRPLLGYKVNPDKSYAIDETTAPTVRRIFQMYADGASFGQIIDAMNADGRRTGTGKSFGKNSLHDLLRNERYAGVFTYNKTPRRVNGSRNAHGQKAGEDIIRIEGGIPAIIDKPLWERVQRKMDTNRKAPAQNKAKLDYLLSGKIYCGHCGSAMVGQSTVVRGQQYAYYECNAQVRLRTCDKKRVRKEQIENAVIDITLAQVLLPETIAYISQRVVEVLEKRQAENTGATDFKAAIAGIEVQINNIVSAISQGVLSAALTTKLQELEENKAALESEMRREQFIQTIHLTSGDVAKFIDQFAKGDKNNPTYRKKLVDIFVNSVYVYDDRMVITYNYSDKTDKEARKPAMAEIFGFGPARFSGTMKSEIFFAKEVFGISLPVTR